MCYPHGNLAAALVNCQFARRTNELWLTDITEPTDEGRLYSAAVLDVLPQMVGWSMAGHMRIELIIDALSMARLVAH